MEGLFLKLEVTKSPLESLDSVIAYLNFKRPLQVLTAPFIEEDIEAQRCSVICSISHKAGKWQNLARNPSSYPLLLPLGPGHRDNARA